MTEHKCALFSGLPAAVQAFAFRVHTSLLKLLLLLSEFPVQVFTLVRLNDCFFEQNLKEFCFFFCPS